MGGGIQPETSAISYESSRVQKVVKVAALSAVDDLALLFGNDFKHQTKLHRDYIPGGVGACAPNGGIFFYNEVPVLVVEAMYQGPQGNACERWFKNNTLMHIVNPVISYLTFACGAVYDGSPIYNTLHIVHLEGYNRVTPHKNSCILSEEPLTENEIHTIIVDLFKRSIT